MTILASTIISNAAMILQDGTNVRWTAAELVKWFNAGQRELVIYKPDACVSNTNITLTANTTKQTIPGTALRLMDLVRCMGTDGATPGGAVRLVVREILDNQIPNWHSVTAAAEIKHFVFDPRDPKDFYVYPRPSGALKVEAILAILPVDVTESGGVVSGNLGMDDVYEGAITDYVLYRAFLKDSQYAGNAARAAAHYTAFGNALGVKLKIDLASTPNATSFYNPNNPGYGKVSQQ